MNLGEFNLIEQEVAEKEFSLKDLELLSLKEGLAESGATSESSSTQADHTHAVIENVPPTPSTSIELSEYVIHKIPEYQKISDLVMQQEENNVDAEALPHQASHSFSAAEPFAWHQQNQTQSSQVEKDKELNEWKKKTTAEPSKVKTKLTYKTYKPKKARKEKRQFNHWLIVGMILILILVNVGVMGYKKFQNYQTEQAAKAQLYLVEQERIIEEQRLKHGKLPNKILSDQSLDELLGNDRNQTQSQNPEKTKPIHFAGNMVNSAQNKNTQFKCDGRTHCTQMLSYEEAVFFLRNCPGTKMDGNGDGQPCEQQFKRH